MAFGAVNRLLKREQVRHRAVAMTCLQLLFTVLLFRALAKVVKRSEILDCKGVRVFAVKHLAARKSCCRCHCII